jgi:pectinesterase
MCAATIDAIGEAVPALKPFIRKYDLVVAKDGSGDFMTVQEAINAVPDYNNEELSILIAPGTYKEKLVVPESKSHVTLIARTEGEVIITYDDFANKISPITGRRLGTSGSSTAYIYAPYFEADGIIFENTASNESFANGGRGVGQAVAVLVAGDCAVFRRCKFLGHQDTLYAYGRKSDPKTDDAKEAAKTQRIPENLQSRQYYEDCFITGTVDYIFQSLRAVQRGQWLCDGSCYTPGTDLWLRLQRMPRHCYSRLRGLSGSTLETLRTDRFHQLHFGRMRQATGLADMGR